MEPTRLRFDPGPRPGDGATIEAAGGIAWRRTALGPRIAIVLRRRHGDCSLPKGRVRAGESPEEAALREVREETGCSVRITGFAGECRYRAGDRPKIVRYFHMECLDAGAVSDSSEARSVVWLRPRRAMKRLSYQDQKRVVELALLERKRVVFAKLAGRLRPQKARFDAALAASVFELERRADRVGGGGPSAATLPGSLLDQAREAGERGNLEQGWNCIAAARRLEAYAMSDDERAVRAATLSEQTRDELAGWRRRAVLSVLEGEHAAAALAAPGRRTAPIDADRLYHALQLRDEGLREDRLRRAGLRRSRGLLLTVVLLAVALLPLYLESVWFATAGGAAVPPTPGEPGVLVAVLLSGLLGAAFSVIRGLPSSGADAADADLSAIALRLFVGAASGFLAYLLLSSGVLALLPATVPALLIASFAAGFAERLVIRSPAPRTDDDPESSERPRSG